MEASEEVVIREVKETFVEYSTVSTEATFMEASKSFMEASAEVQTTFTEAVDIPMEVASMQASI